MNKTKKLFLLQSKDLVKLAISFSTNFLWNLSKKVWIPPRFFFNNKQSNKKLLIIIDKQPENPSKIKFKLKISFPDKRKKAKVKKNFDDFWYLSFIYTKSIKSKLLFKQLFQFFILLFRPLILYMSCTILWIFVHSVKICIRYFVLIALK